jgi:hypothetical protein
MMAGVASELRCGRSLRRRSECLPQSVERPADRCPYRRPFAADFDACPAYQPVLFVPLDMEYRPLATVWTCANLDSAVVAMQRNRIFPRCRIGDVAARQAWVGAQRPDRLAEIRALRDALNPRLGDLITEMWAAKADQLRAETDAAQLAATARLRALGDRFMAIVDAFFEEHAAQLERLGFPLAPMRRLYGGLVETWIGQPSAAVPEMPDAVLAAFAPEVRAFLKPG